MVKAVLLREVNKSFQRRILVAPHRVANRISSGTLVQAPHLVANGGFLLAYSYGRGGTQLAQFFNNTRSQRMTNKNSLIPDWINWILALKFTH